MLKVSFLFRPLLLVATIVLGTTIRYHIGIADFWMEQSYLVRELMSSLYKILWVLVPAVLIFYEYRRQNIGFHYSCFGIIVAGGLGLALLGAKLIALEYSPHIVEPINILPFTLFFTLVVNSFCEEYVFRGMLMQYLETKWTSRQAVVFQAFCFALIHIPFYLSLGRQGLTLLTGLGSVFLLGLFFAYIRKQTKSLFYPMLMHSIWNGVIIFL